MAPKKSDTTNTTANSRGKSSQPVKPSPNNQLTSNDMIDLAKALKTTKYAVPEAKTPRKVKKGRGQRRARTLRDAVNNLKPGEVLVLNSKTVLDSKNGTVKGASRKSNWDPKKAKSLTGSLKLKLVSNNTRKLKKAANMLGKLDEAERALAASPKKSKVRSPPGNKKTMKTVKKTTKKEEKKESPKVPPRQRSPSPRVSQLPAAVPRRAPAPQRRIK